MALAQGSGTGETLKSDLERPTPMQIRGVMERLTPRQNQAEQANRKQCLDGAAAPGQGRRRGEGCRQGRESTGLLCASLNS